MKPTLIWLLLAGVGAILLLGDTVDAWNRHFFNRYARNWLQQQQQQQQNIAGADGVAAFGGGSLSGGSDIANNSPQIDDFNAIFGLGNDLNWQHSNNVGNAVGAGGAGIGGGGGGGGGIAGSGVGLTAFGAGYDFGAGGFGGQQQQTEIYGIVEPLIEDTPCVDRACQLNDDCCPTGVCVSTYGEGKCIYVYGRKRDLCHRNADCELGMSCVKGAAGNLICQPSTSTIHLLNNAVGGAGAGAGSGNGGNNNGGIDGAAGGMGSNNAIGFSAGSNNAPKLPLNTKQFGEDCVSSSECNVAKGLCCQLQRTHHRIRPRKLCAYFRDPFMCIDIMPTGNEEVRDSHLLSAFSQRRM